MKMKRGRARARERGGHPVGRREAAPLDEGAQGHGARADARVEGGQDAAEGRAAPAGVDVLHHVGREGRIEAAEAEAEHDGGHHHAGPRCGRRPGAPSPRW